MDLCKEIKFKKLFNKNGSVSLVEVEDEQIASVKSKDNATDFRTELANLRGDICAIITTRDIKDFPCKEEGFNEWMNQFESQCKTLFVQSVKYDPAENSEIKPHDDFYFSEFTKYAPESVQLFLQGYKKDFKVLYPTDKMSWEHFKTKLLEEIPMMHQQFLTKKASLGN